MNRYYKILCCLFFMYAASSGMEKSKEGNYKKFATQFYEKYLKEVENTVAQCCCSIKVLSTSPFNVMPIVACTEQNALIPQILFDTECRGSVRGLHDLHHDFLFLRSSYSRQLGRKLRCEIFMELFESFLGIDANKFRNSLVVKRSCFLKNVYFFSLKDALNEYSICLTPSIDSPFFSREGENKLSILYTINCGCPRERGGCYIKRPSLLPGKEEEFFQNLDYGDFARSSRGSICWTEQSEKTLKDPNVPIKISSLILKIPLFNKERDCSLVYDSKVHNENCSGKAWLENAMEEDDTGELMEDMRISTNELLVNFLLKESCNLPIAAKLSYLFKENEMQVIWKKTEGFSVKSSPIKIVETSYMMIDCAAMVTMSCNFLPQNERYCLFLTGDKNITPSSRNTIYFGKMGFCVTCQLPIVPVIMLKNIEKGVQGNRDDTYNDVVLFYVQTKERKGFRCDTCATISWPFGIELGKDLLESVMKIMHHEKEQSKQYTTDEYVMSLFF